jgi:hypothetical protein
MTTSPFIFTKIAISRFTFLLIFLFVLSSILFSQEEPSLRGIKPIRVVAAINEESYGISSAQIQDDIELKLRLAKIHVDSKSDVELRVVIMIIDIGSQPKGLRGSYGTVNIILEQPVRLINTPSIVVRAITWQSAIEYLHGPPDDFGRRCRDAAKDIVDTFINAYLSANPD